MKQYLFYIDIPIRFFPRPKWVTRKIKIKANSFPDAYSLIIKTYAPSQISMCWLII